MIFEWNWLAGDFSEPSDSESFSTLKIVLDGKNITRIYDRVSGGERDSVNIPLYPLALGIVENWWSLLYEPRKSVDDLSGIEARHSMDAYVPGFVFPAINAWSAGEEAILIENPDVPQEFSNLEFFRTNLKNELIPREQFEHELFTLINSVVTRSTRNIRGDELGDAWNRILTSIHDHEEKDYCIASGKLGIDPYDPDSLDITEVSEGMSPNLFSDVCEAVTPDEFLAATEWTRENERSIDKFPAFDIDAFGPPPDFDSSLRPWDAGYIAARKLRRTLSLENLSPRQVIDEIFGAAVRSDAPAITDRRPYAIEGVVRRDNGARVAIPKVPARLRRTTLCRGAFRAWMTDHEDSLAVTTASTIGQQASRAFAAELLAPAAQLKERAGGTGLTPRDVEEFAEENVCPEQTIIWQAYNHGIRLRGVHVPRS